MQGGDTTKLSYSERFHCGPWLHLPLALGLHFAASQLQSQEAGWRQSSTQPTLVQAAACPDPAATGPVFTGSV